VNRAILVRHADSAAGARGILNGIVHGFRALLARREDTILVVAHGLVVRYLLNALDGRDPAPLLDGVPCAEPYELKATELERAVDRLEAWTWDPRW